MSADRRIRFLPGFHRCNPDPSINYGIGGVRMIWTIQRDTWGIEWDVFTGWYMPAAAFRAANPDCDRNHGPLTGQGGHGGAVTWHAPVPMFDHDPHPNTATCDITGGDCYGDVGFLLGDDLFDLLTVEGDEAVWTRLDGLLTDRIRETEQT